VRERWKRRTFACRAQPRHAKDKADSATAANHRKRQKQRCQFRPCHSKWQRTAGTPKKMEQRFYSNGKLLLTGEYLVLDGAKALALPTVYGQDLTIVGGKPGHIEWKSFDSDGSLWFKDTISFEEIKTGIQQQDSIKSTLIAILRQVHDADTGFLADDGFSVETRLTFPRKWGLGTSSTLINNLAQWRGIDAFELLYKSFGGSGYDIACAQHGSPLLFWLEDGKPNVETVSFRPDFRDRLFFVYLNRKQSSKAAIAAYYSRRLDDLGAHVAAADALTQTALHAQNIGVFARAMRRHEILMSDILEMRTAAETFFPDFDGVIKSLGGWGGDFVLVVAHENPSEYFRARGFETVVPFAEMVL
jgi:mevalonate kinase